ncbi:hypothetical protein RSOLAG1IB_02071 [Rhizoctonia solani AG-1 IB]|uniref:Uncharacterized protein n=1 Tax=Thanatephorus cucumeris (strain AG1-IB / isolate 7/3/14) TaxID=1108050 RepID=A0A0B7FMB9_THACB|nr:hypothetical protein RSOLAG1IB_02071 [Rhizoctonia solani AG-1 IB]
MPAIASSLIGSMPHITISIMALVLPSSTLLASNRPKVFSSTTWYSSSIGSSCLGMLAELQMALTASSRALISCSSRIKRQAADA